MYSSTLALGLCLLSICGAQRISNRYRPLDLYVNSTGTFVVQVSVTESGTYSQYLTITGPTRVKTDISDIWSGTSTLTDGAISTSKPYQIFPWSDYLTSSEATIVMDALWYSTLTIAVLDTSTYNNVTLTPPTTTILTGTGRREPPQAPLIRYIKPTDRCKGPEDKYSNPIRTAVFESKSTLTDGQKLVWTGCSTYQGGSECGVDTYVGPTVADLSSTAKFFPGGPPAFDLKMDTCQTYCDRCFLMFPTVDVYYWPVDGADLSCLSSNDTLSNNTSVLKRWMKGDGPESVPINFKALTKRADEAVVASEDAFVSPSVYVVFPIISALDKCGELGTAVTSLTRAYNPEDLSTYVVDSVSNFFTPSAGQISQFDFRYAECPPSSIAEGNYWIPVLDNGRHYNPIIVAPDDLHELQPDWNLCYNAPFQGKDPPRALTSKGNLIVAPTNPVQIIPEPARPSPGITAPVNPSPTVFTPIPENGMMTPAPIVNNPPAQSPDPPANDSSDENGGGSKNNPLVPLPVNDSPSGGDQEQAPKPADPANPATPARPANPAIPDDTGPKDPGSPQPPNLGNAPTNDNSGSNPTDNAGTPSQPNPPNNNNDSNNDNDNDSDNNPPSSPPLPTTILKFGTATLTANPSHAFVISSQTLTPGGTITVSGTPIALPSSFPGSAVVGGETVALITLFAAVQTGTAGGSGSGSGSGASGAAEGTGGAGAGGQGEAAGGEEGQPTAAAILTVGTKTYTAHDSTFIINGQTLAPGGSVVVGGTTVALPSGTGLSVAVVDGTSVGLGVAESTAGTSEGTAEDAGSTSRMGEPGPVGGAVASGIGGLGRAGEVLTGGACGRQGGWWVGGLGVVVGVVGVLG